MISFQYEDFVDIAINDMKIDGSVMDKSVSLKAGLPIKTLNSYLKDFLTIIYRANVQGVSSDVYKKRNPVSGHYYEKGLKDISRTKLICSIEKEHKNKYKKYCKIIVDITKERLRQMNAKERDEYFNILKELVPKIRNETSKKTN
jgi:glutamyl-tRNA reductase